MDDRTRRLYVTKRSGLIGRLTDEGRPRQRVEGAFDAWEGEALRRGLSRTSPTFWDEAEEYIDELVWPRVDERAD